MTRPAFETLPAAKKWMFAKAYGKQQAGRQQAVLGAGSWAAGFGAQQGLQRFP
jgi:hypothetical protein